MDSPTLPADIAQLSPACRQSLSKIKKGMTRAVLEEHAHLDGGLNVMFRKERYVINSCDGSNMRMPKGALKLELQMKPAGMSQAVYALGKWVPPAPSPNDRLASLADLYWQAPFFD